MADLTEEKKGKVDLSPSGYRTFVENTPCVRDSFLYGVSSGIGIGFTRYIFTTERSHETEGFAFALTLCLGYFIVVIGKHRTNLIPLFYVTEHIRKACDAAVLSFAAVSLISWQTCRYFKRKRNEQMKQTVEMLNQLNKKSGEIDNEIRRT